MVVILGMQLSYLPDKANRDITRIAEVINAGTDFFRNYGDATHHGKEEDILFRRLSEKQLSEEHRRTLKELKDEHNQARGAIGKMAVFGRALWREDESVIDELVQTLAFITTLYPAHIDKEDNHFFKPTMQYLTEDEKQKMLKDFAEYDQRMIHQKYTRVVEKFEWKRPG